MKLRMKRKAMVVLAAGMLMSAAAPAAAMAAEKATGPALTASYNGDVNTLEAAKDATQLIVVIGNRQDPAKSRLDWYKRDTDGKLVQVLADTFGIGTGLMKNCVDAFCIVLSLIMGLLFAGKPVGIGIGKVCAVMLVGRVIALFHHIFGKAMLQAAGLESGRN